MSGITNTVILTNFEEGELDDDRLIQDLNQKLLESTPETETIKFVTLRKFQRILIICEQPSTAFHLKELLNQSGFVASFAMRDNNISTEEFLQLPDQGKRFLISPPPSPPSGWISREEDKPNTRSVYSAEEMSDLLFHRLGGKLEPSHQLEEENNAEEEVTLCQEVLLENANGNPIIILDPPEVPGVSLDGALDKVEQFKTAMPPHDLTYTTVE